MSFAKIINESHIQLAPRTIVLNNTTITNPNAEQYAQAGYLEVVKNFTMVTEQVYDEEGNPVYDEETGEPVTWTHEVAPAEFYHYENHFVEKEATLEKPYGYIEHTHVSVKDPQPIYSDLIVRGIRTKYSLNDELALQRQQNNSDEKKAEFDEYNTYCNTCKTQARAKIEAWEEA